MKVLKVLGWIFVPYVMIFVSWKKIGPILRILGAVWAFFCVLVTIGAIFGDSNTDDKVTTAATVAVTASPKVAKESPTAKPEKATAAAKKWPDVEVNAESIRAAIKGAGGSNTVSVSDKTVKDISFDAGTVIIKMNPGTIWDEKRFLLEFGHSVVSFSEILFKNKLVNKVTLEGYTTFTDQYGKSNEGRGVTITWDRATNDKLDYKGFENLLIGDYTRAYSLAVNYQIHPGIYNGLKNKDGLPIMK